MSIIYLKEGVHSVHGRLLMEKAFCIFYLKKKSLIIDLICFSENILCAIDLNGN